MRRLARMRRAARSSRSAFPCTTNWRRTGSRWLGLGLNLVFPPICAGCQAAIEPGTAIALCDPCREKFIDTSPACDRCGCRRPPDGAPEVCSHCRQWHPKFERVFRLGSYEGELRRAVLRIKRTHERALAIALAEILGEAFAARFSQQPPDVVIPVPMHWTRRIWRGTNSPETIATRLASRLNIPLATEILVRSKRTAPQAPLSPPKRRANVRGAFRVRPHSDLPGARILLVDDIMTTGATLNEAAKVLATAGAGEITVAVLARAEGHA